MSKRNMCVSKTTPRDELKLLVNIFCYSIGGEGKGRRKKDRRSENEIRRNDMCQIQDNISRVNNDSRKKE